MVRTLSQNNDGFRDLNVLAGSLGLGGIPKSWHASWPNSLHACPQANPSFLEPGYVDRINTWLHLSKDAYSTLAKAVSRIAKRSDLRLLAWHCHRLMFEEAIPEDFYSWPMPDAAMGELAPVFYAVALLPEVPKLAAKHGKRGIPAEVTVNTLKDIDLWLCNYKEKHGRKGLVELGWFSNHFAEKLYRLGRLQYEPQAFGGRIKVFRRISDGALTVFSEGGIRFSPDGEVDGTNGVFNPNAWESVFEQNKKTVRGNPIPGSGRASREVIEIAAEEWALVLSRGDAILNIHIPADGKMDYTLCLESFSKALEFFPMYRPDVQFKGFACHSWLLDPDLGRLLPADSNIVRFQREFYLYPVLGDDSQMFERVFGGKPADLSGAPGETLLQRVIINHLAGGGRMRTGAGFMLPSL
jgi:hypothetical protein